MADRFGLKPLTNEQRTAQTTMERKLQDNTMIRDKKENEDNWPHIIRFKTQKKKGNGLDI